MRAARRPADATKNFLVVLSAFEFAGRIALQGPMADASQQVQDWRRKTEPQQRDVGAALAALSDEDLLRLRAIARLRARSLPNGMSWSDLLHEAVLRALTGARPWPPDVPLLGFLGGVMRSVCDEQWRRLRRENQLPTLDDTRSPGDPERACAAAEALTAIQRLFASDAAALKVITGLIGGMAAEDIRRHYGFTVVEYDTTRRRIRRALLRNGLAWSWS